MIDFTYNPIIPADYKSPRERTSLRSLSPVSYTHLVGLKTVIASSYQAVSGSGQHGIAELETQVRAVVDGHPVVKNVYPHQRCV